MGKLSSKSLTQNPENRQNLGLQNIEDPAKNFGQDPDLPNPVRSGFTFRTDRNPSTEDRETRFPLPFWD